MYDKEKINPKNKHQAYELAQYQALSLESKVIMTNQRIKQWYEAFDGEVYVSFSGGKDSTVLLHLVRELYPDVEAVFIDTGLEYPEIREFVKTFDNVTWIRPDMTFKQVCNKYGFPFISKKHSDSIEKLRTLNLSEMYRNYLLYGDERGKIGTLPAKFHPLLKAPFLISGRCCDVMKKKPANQHEKKTGRKPILATMASESLLRKESWLQHGCNAFEKKKPVSRPMSFWTEQDVLHYIKEKCLKISFIYGDIVVDESKSKDTINGQMNIVDMLGCYSENDVLTTTGCKRTGCMFCGFGCHVRGDSRFVDMKTSHPKQYEFIFKPESEGGLGYKEKIDYINEHCGTNIRY